jgi:hypothetical protein
MDNVTNESVEYNEVEFDIPYTRLPRVGVE